MQIYVHKNNQQLGPFTEAEIKAQLAAGTITLQDHVWWQGQANWLPLGQTQLVTPGAAPLPGVPTAPMPDAATYAAQGSTSGLAIWSLVCGCLCILCGLFAAVPAIVLGHLALGDIKRNPGRSGKGLALAGMIIGYIIAGLSIIALCFYAALMPTILKAIKDQQHLQQSGQTFVPIPSTNSADESSTNTDQSTNSPDQTTPTATPTNSATATPPTSDSSTNTPTATPMNQ